jgi:uncharacterized protein (DUF305 family)
MDSRRWLTLGGVVVALVAAGGAIAWARTADQRPAGAERPQASHSGPAATVIQPGRPGEPAKITDTDRVAPLDASTYNAVDTAFVQMMIAHHQQAILMADLAPSRAANPQVRNLAERMSVAQKIEIDVLRAWLKERRRPDHDPAHNHATMPGMQTPAAITALTAARGADFDKRFVIMMTAHHEGARVMAGDVLKGGTDQRINEIANEMAVEQTSEIRRMRDLKVT